ncbi:MAG: hypothetical protein B7C24_04485 [Bacteroidetes bacterium 4572_77]|nr:MAG: hypothetical protein B7C24_04485 [Bacteroidetes bacterium 4572_77]
MEKHLLSKSTFIKGYHCLKSLYLHKKRPFLRDRLTAEQLAKFRRGHQIGDLAQQLFPNGIDVSPKSPSQYQKSAIRTQELIANGQEVIYEATFQFEKVLVMLDILVKTPQGWEAYEVKSSKSLSETYFTDAALQYWVISHSGLALQKFSLIYVNENYRLEKELDLNSYFITQDVSKEVQEKSIFIGEKIKEEKEMLQEAHSPKTSVGNHCFSPYKCDFVGFCWKKINPKPYLPKSLNTKESPISIKKDRLAISFIFGEQALPLCPGDKAYQTNCIGYKLGEEKAVIIGESCEEKAKFVHEFFQNIPQNTFFITDNALALENWIHDLIPAFPSYKKSAERLLENTQGIIDDLESAQIFTRKERHLYPLAYLAKELLKDNSLSKSPINSDLLAQRLFLKIEKDLFSDISPETAQLQAYLEEKVGIIKNFTML